MIERMHFNRFMQSTNDGSWCLHMTGTSTVQSPNGTCGFWWISVPLKFRHLWDVDVAKNSSVPHLWGLDSLLQFPWPIEMLHVVTIFHIWRIWEFLLLVTDKNRQARCKIFPTTQLTEHLPQLCIKLSRPEYPLFAAVDRVSSDLDDIDTFFLCPTQGESAPPQRGCRGPGIEREVRPERLRPLCTTGSFRVGESRRPTASRAANRFSDASIARCKATDRGCRDCVINPTSDGASASPDTETATTPSLRPQSSAAVHRVASGLETLSLFSKTPSESAVRFQSGAQSKLPECSEVREFSRNIPSRNGTENLATSAARNRWFCRAARHARSAARAARSKGRGSAQRASRFMGRSRLIKLSARMTLLASSHRHVTDVGGTCCLLSGSDAKAGALVAHTFLHKTSGCWQQKGAALVTRSFRDEGAVTSPSILYVGSRESGQALAWRTRPLALPRCTQSLERAWRTQLEQVHWMTQQALARCGQPLAPGRCIQTLWCFVGHLELLEYTWDAIPVQVDPCDGHRRCCT